MTYSNFGVINSVGLTNVSNEIQGYTPVASANLSSFFLTSMTNLITSSSGKVSQINAYLGTGTATQSTELDKPTTDATTLNGKNVIDFAGGGQRLFSNVDFNIASASASSTIGILAKRNLSLTEITSLCGQFSQTGGDFRRWKIEIDASDNLILYFSTSSFGIRTITNASQPGTDWKMYWIIYTHTNPSPTVFKYDDNVVLGSGLPSGTTNANIGTVIGGSAPSETTTWKGSWASFAKWNKALSDAEITSEITNINNYWGLSLS